MKLSLWAIVAVLCLAPLGVRAEGVCPRPEPGSKVAEPEDLRSRNGVLEAHLTASNAGQSNGAIRYCYTDAAGHESPTLRVHPGDLVILHLTNALTEVSHGSTEALHAHAHTHSAANPCTSGIMS